MTSEAYTHVWLLSCFYCFHFQIFNMLQYIFFTKQGSETSNLENSMKAKYNNKTQEISSSTSK
jgi:hypothetical protein